MNRFGGEFSVFNQKYIKVDEKYLTKDTTELPVQINGVVRFKVEIPTNLDEKQIEETVVNDERLKKYTIDKEIKKVIVVKSRIINVVVK